MSDEFFETWLGSITAPEHPIPMCQDGAIIGDYQRWQAKRSRVPEGQEMDEADRRRLKQLDAEGEEILERLRASKATYMIKAPTGDLIDEIATRHPIPQTPPVFDAKRPVLPEDPTGEDYERYQIQVDSYNAQHKNFLLKHGAKWEAYQKQQSDVLLMRDLELIAKSVKAIVTPDGVRHDVSLTVDDVRAMIPRVGEAQMSNLLKGIQDTAAAKELPDLPF